MSVLIRHSDDSNSRWETMDAADYTSEDELQGLLEKGSAQLIPPDPSLDEAYVVYVRELWTASGPIDLVGIGSSGSVTVMECKLARNRQIKREVVGQVLDYAAALWETDPAALFAAFKTALRRDVFDVMREAFGTEPEAFDEEACREEVARRLRDGDFRLMIAVDEIDADLRRIIRYVNSRGSHRGLKLVALDFKRFRFGATEVLVPESWGDESPTDAAATGERTETQLLHLEYWTAFGEFLTNRGSPVLFRKPAPNSIAVSRANPIGLMIRAYNLATDGSSGIELSPRTPDALRQFSAASQAEVEARLARHGKVEWRPDSAMPLVTVTRDGSTQPVVDRDHWPAIMEWMAAVIDDLWTLYTDQPVTEPRDA